MREFLAVGCGGFLGAIARYGVGLGAQRFASGFPLATLTVNVIGCLVLGFLVSLWSLRSVEPGPRELFLSVGFLGALTTFSTFGVETLGLLREGETRAALVSVLANLALGLTAAYLGHLAARAFSG